MKNNLLIIMFYGKKLVIINYVLCMLIILVEVNFVENKSLYILDVWGYGCV